MRAEQGPCDVTDAEADRLLSLQLSPEQQQRYEKIHRQKIEAGEDQTADAWEEPQEIANDELEPNAAA